MVISSKNVFFLVLALLYSIRLAFSFSITKQQQSLHRTDNHRRTRHQIDSALNVFIDGEESEFPDAEIIEFPLEQHRTLGCTVEESLENADYVFVSKVAEEGTAQQAGIEVGDVIIGLSSFVGEIENAIGMGIEKVRTSVASIPDSEVLEIRVARGTDVMSGHEDALIDLCMLSEAEDVALDECVQEYWAGEYYDEDCDPAVDETCEVEDEGENLVNNLYNMWDEDLPEKQEIVEEVKVEAPKASKVKPWSVRSSPSGTWVRNPATGKMENIDE